MLKLMLRILVQTLIFALVLSQASVAGTTHHQESDTNIIFLQCR